MTLSIRELMFRFKQISDLHPQINEFGCGPLYDLQDDIRYYPYLWVINDISHNVIFTELNKYKAIEYSFILRCGDKNNDSRNKYNQIGIGSNNGLDISSDTFTMLVDIINAISEDTLGLFTDVSLIDDIVIEPFYNEDTGDVNGHEASITLRVKIENPCISPLTD